MAPLALPEIRLRPGLRLSGAVTRSVSLALGQGGGDAMAVVVASMGAGAVIGILLAGGRGARTLAGGAVGGMVGGACGPVVIWLAERTQTPWQALPCGML